MVNFAEVGNDLYTGKRSIDFIGRQKVWYVVSGVLIALALIGVFARGLNFGIEFRGGSEFRVPGVSSTADYEQRAQSAMSSAGVDGNIVATVIGNSTVRVQTESTGDTSDAAKTALASTFAVPTQNISASSIGPSWGASVSAKAIQGLVIFLVLVAIFMAIYFRTWTMAVAGLVALVHDLIITVGIYALFGFEITPSSMIGFLTILGYSLYDTVVVFDKVRENTTAALSSKRTTYRDAANLAVNQTLVRSINTTVVALLPIAAILVVGFTALGPGTLLDLSLALFVGIAVGAYSSIFIATPLLVDLRRREHDIVELDRVVNRTSGRAGSRPTVAAGVRGRSTGGGATVMAPGDVDLVDAPDPADLTDGATPALHGDGTPPAGGPREVHKWAQAGPRNQPQAPATVEAVTAAREAVAVRVAGLLRDVPDFPSPGILFKDFTPLLADAEAVRAVVDEVAALYAGRVDVVAGIEARGFVLGAAIAYRLGVGFVPVRKAGKLPPETHAVSYALEYGEATLEITTTSFAPAQRVLVVDDVLATGGTAAAACELVERTGAVVVAVDVVLELGFLPGREALAGREVNALVVG